MPALYIVASARWQSRLRAVAAAWSAPVQFVAALGETISPPPEPFLLVTDQAPGQSLAPAVWCGLAEDQEAEAELLACGAGDILPSPLDDAAAARRLRRLGRWCLAEHRAAALRGVLAALAHDARLPLLSVKGYLGLLLDGSLGALDLPQTQAVSGARLAADRLARLLDDALDWSVGPGHLRRARLDIVPLLASAVDVLAGLAEAAGVVVTIEAGDAPLWVDGDAERLERVVCNLVSNAVRHSPRAGQVAVAAWAETDEVVITVDDQGPGLAIEDEGRIFERGYRTRSGSLVLGLSLTREQVEAHGGRLSVGRGAAGGACFTVRLPLAEG